MSSSRARNLPPTWSARAGTRGRRPRPARRARPRRRRGSAERASEAAGRGRHPSPRPGRSRPRAGVRRRATSPRRAGPAQRLVLDRPHRARASDTRLHLVVDVEDPVLVADCAAAPGKSGGMGMKPPSPCTGSSTTHATDVRIDVLPEEVLEARDRVVRSDAAVRVRARAAVDLRRERAEARLVGDLAVIAIVSSVRPWKALSKTTRPGGRSRRARS